MATRRYSPVGEIAAVEMFSSSYGELQFKKKLRSESFPEDSVLRFDLGRKMCHLFLRLATS